MTHTGDHGIPDILHRSRSLTYRNPFGAVPSGTCVTLAIDAPDNGPTPILCYAYGLYTLTYHEMSMGKSDASLNRYEVTLRMSADAGLFFYWFKFFRGDNGVNFYYVRSSGDMTGAGRLSDVPARVGPHEIHSPHAFQITVFDETMRTPDWMKGALIYQIFPDRFSRESSFSIEAVQAEDDKPERIFHESWDEDVDIDGKPDTGYVACDFFGGSLRGIAEKADYLQQMNVELIYLNPIFKARSNHRYDTGDYLEVDPLLGGQAGYDAFAREMKAGNIRFILDGVFNHTGADSRYFNKYGRYPETGAYQALVEGGISRYSSWYSFSKGKSGEILYDSWWGFPELPNVDENDLTFRDFILGPHGVVAHWLRQGASGFRLDVSDELPDSFIREMKKRVSAETNGEGVVLGEVWEDASNKISYGTYRDFILGRTHDSAMGYPFKDAVIGFLTGALSAREANHRLETQRENYPAPIHSCVMNLLSSHDIPRAVNLLAGVKDPGDRRLQKSTRLTDDQLELGFRLHRLGFVFQIGYIGCPTVYYGDEVGMEGFRDPLNRRTYPWGRLSQRQEEQLAFFQRLGRMRKLFPVLRTGYYRTLEAEEDLFVFERTLDDDGKDLFGSERDGPRRIVFALNRSRERSLSVSLSEEVSVSEFDWRSDAAMISDAPIVSDAPIISDDPIISDAAFIFEKRTEINVGALDFRIFICAG